MGKRTTTEGVSPKGDRIQIRFSWRGQELRPTLDLPPTAANLKHAARLRALILDDIRGDQFNLLEYFPNYRFAEKVGATADIDARRFKDWCALWVEVAARTLEHSTLEVYRQHLTCYWVQRFGEELPRRVTNEAIMKHLATLSKDHFDEDKGRMVKGLSRKTQNNILIPLRGVFDLICSSIKDLSNPMLTIKNVKPEKPQPDPFSMEEVEVILAALKKEFGEEYADYFEFAFFAGPRPSEQIALLWQDVDLRSGVVRVRRARVRGQDKERTKTHYERDVELNSRALAVVERQRARTQLKGDHVFRNPATGKPWTDFEAQRRVWTRVLRTAKIRHRAPKECRDTSVTLNLMAGADPAWVAKQHGHSVVVMMKDYAKWMPKGDRGRNLAVVNSAVSTTDSALEPHYAKP